MNYENFSIKNYKCFNDQTIINGIKQINIIIGRNNIGKSSLIDVIEYLNNFKEGFYDAEIIEQITIDESNLEKGFSKNVIHDFYHTEYETAVQYIGRKVFRKITYKKTDNGNRQNYELVLNDLTLNNIVTKNNQRNWNSFITNNIRKNKIVKRIYAERDIESEIHSSNNKVSGNGEGATNIINRYLNTSALDEKIVKDKMLNKLNEIMGDDANFEEITVQAINEEKNEWEIFLKENNKPRVALSKSGSGLKTILLILLYTILIPNMENKELDNYIFAFEEIENNLHPALLRRTLKYIEEISGKGAQFFLTTHSNIMLDVFQNNDDVSFYNVIKNNNSSTVENLNSITGKRNCLEELGFKASDILQPNGIIWVEGPSDRIYINKWIEIWSQNKYREGMNYQCLIYGGRLLSNMTFDEEKVNKFINLLNVNRNAIVLIDSDKKYKSSKINGTKNRIIEECEKMNLMSWVTKGREIENYIPKEIIDEAHNIKNDLSFKQYDDIKNYLNQSANKLGDKFDRHKINFAYDYVDKMTFENMKDSLDLDEKMNDVVDVIGKWNY